jgi:hypothetical protein
MRRRPPSCLGANPSGEQIKGGSGGVWTTRPSCRSAWSFAFIMSGASKADKRLLESMCCSGPVYPICVPKRRIRRMWKERGPGYWCSKVAHACGIKGDADFESGSFEVSVRAKAGDVFGRGGAGTQLNLGWKCVT